MEPDERLMERSQQGDQGAFETLVRRYEARLYAFFFRLTGGRGTAVAEDLFQETFLRAFKNRSAFDLQRTFAPWLYGIAAIVWKDHLRREARAKGWPALSEEAAEAQATPFHNRTKLVEELERREVHEIVREEIGRLPPDPRLVLILRHYQGLSYQEIGKALNLPLGTVKSRLHSAIATLRERLSRRGLLPPS